MDGIDGTDEVNIQDAILQLLRDGRIWTNAELKRRLRKELPLTSADRGVGKRTNEELWENRVNNALSPSRSSSLYGKGHVENFGHGKHRITGAGLSFVNEDEIDVASLVEELLARKR